MPFPRYWYLGQLVVYFIGGIGFASSGVINIVFNAGRYHLLIGLLEVGCGLALAIGYVLTFRALMVLYQKVF